MKPMASPILRLPRSSVHLPNAPMGPAPVARPSANSPITPVEPMRMTQMKYGIRNVMPPQRETMMGKRQMLPMPTAEPMQARIKPHLDLKPSRCVVVCLSAISFPPIRMLDSTVTLRRRFRRSAVQVYLLSSEFLTFPRWDTARGMRGSGASGGCAPRRYACWGWIRGLHTEP